MVVMIKYDGGKMEVNVDEFLKMRKINKYKKLMKLIRSSDTPELENDIGAYIERMIPEYEYILTNARKAYVAMMNKVAEHEALLERCKRELEYLKPGTSLHKEKKEDLKSARDAVRYWKGQVIENKRQFNEYEKQKFFYEKCLAIES